MDNKDDLLMLREDTVNHEKQLYIQNKFLVFIFFNMITMAYGGDSFLMDVTVINWMTFFSFIFFILLIILKIAFNISKEIKMIFVLFVLLYIAGKIEAWHKSYIPIIGYYLQSPYEYGEYEEVSQIECLGDKNITNLFYGSDWFHNFIITADTEIQLLSYDSIYVEYPYMRDNIFKCQDKMKIEKSSSNKIAYLNDKIFLLNDDNKTMSTYSYRWNKQKKGEFFIKINDDSLDRYLNKNNEDYNLSKRLAYGQQSKLFVEKNDCNSTKYSLIIMDKKLKSFYLCSDNLKYATTHLKCTPKIATYIRDSDTVLIAYEEKKGLYILKNKYTKTYNKIQESVTHFLKMINQPKWNKVDLTKINFDQSKLKKIIDIFTPYEKNQYHSVEYSVIAYDGNQATVKANIDEKNIVLFYLNLKKGKWNIEGIE